MKEDEGIQKDLEGMEVQSSALKPVKDQGRGDR